MKIVRISDNQNEYYGILNDKSVELIKGDPFEDIQTTGRSIKLEDVKLLAPANPRSILAIGLNYRKHAIESGIEIPDHPMLFIKASSTLRGPGESIIRPAFAPNEVDYEAELVIVIGKKAKNVAIETAGSYIFGYTCGNDVSARDVQLKQDTQWARGKSFDTFAPIGPWIETEFDGNNAPIQLRLNAKVMQESNTTDLIFSCEYLVSYLSKCMTLYPGTVIFSGTPSGVGFARKPPVFLQPGDVVEVEIAGIGTLRNVVEDESVEPTN
jgi:2-keto-4-pentenoate hydratase/2-oxohepta-3-ene-1,7-dioic acid hydratase in catechol pathway